MHSNVLISNFMSFGVVWRVAQILNKKVLNFWAVTTKTGSAFVVSACWMLTKSIFYAQQTKRSEKQCANFQIRLKWIFNTEFTTADFVIFKKNEK